MPNPGTDDRVAEMTDSGGAEQDAWTRTLDEMAAMAAEREDDGWRTVIIPAGHTAPEPPDAGADGRYGLVYVVPGNKAEAFREAAEAGTFPRYEVYRGTTESRVFLVTELLDPDTETAVYVAGTYRRQDATPLLRAARRQETMYTHLQTLDETQLGTFEHESHEEFFDDRDIAALDAADHGPNRNR